MQAQQFSEWLQKELDSREWDYAELARRSRLTRGAVSHVMNGDRQAGVDFCIAIARAMGLPREEVFKKRGWLSETSRPVISDADPRLTEMAEAVRELPFEKRELILNVWEAALIAAGVKYGRKVKF